MYKITLPEQIQTYEDLRSVVSATVLDQPYTFDEHSILNCVLNYNIQIDNYTKDSKRMRYIIISMIRNTINMLIGIDKIKNANKQYVYID